MEPVRYDYGAPPPPNTSVLAILSLVFAFLCQPVGFVLGVVAMVLIGRSQGRLGGMGLAIGGTVASAGMFFFCIPMIAAIAIPGLLMSRIGANEASAVGSLKAICSGQEQCRHKYGEYATLEVLAGRKPPRGQKSPEPSPFIPPLLGNVDSNGVSAKAGYCFKVYVREGGSYVAYAWPQARTRSGVRVFAIEEQGQPFATAESPFEGSGNAPPEDAIRTGKWVPVG
jgi:hypothetical protein